MSSSEDEDTTPVVRAKAAAAAPDEPAAEQVASDNEDSEGEDPQMPENRMDMQAMVTYFSTLLRRTKKAARRGDNDKLTPRKAALAKATKKLADLVQTEAMTLENTEKAAQVHEASMDLRRYVKSGFESIYFLAGDLADDKDDVKIRKALYEVIADAVDRLHTATDYFIELQAVESARREKAAEEEAREEEERRQRPPPAMVAPPPAALAKVPFIDRSNCNLTTIDPKVFERTGVTKVSFFSNQISRLPAEINQLQMLQTLDLSYNRLWVLPQEICELKCLRELILIGNHVSVFPEGMDQMENMVHLDLTSNHLRSFPEEVTVMPNLARLDLGRNKLKYLPAEIRYMRALEYLNLSENKLRSLPAQIGFCSLLKELLLSENRIDDLPAEIGFLSHLEVLRVARNQISALPLEVSAMTQLAVLDLTGNQLEELSPEIFFANWTEVDHTAFADEDEGAEPNSPPPRPPRSDDGAEPVNAPPERPQRPGVVRPADLIADLLSTAPTPFEQETDVEPEYHCASGLGFLRELLVRGNNVAELPVSFFGLTMLEVVDLTDNKVSIIDPAIESLGNLRVLKLAGNQIAELPEEIGHLDSLNELNLSGNPLAYLPASLPGLPNLGVLTLGHTKLESLPEWDSGFGQPFPSLEELFLSGSRQFYALPHYLGQCSNLSIIYACHCALESLPVSIGNCGNLTVLDVANNSLASLPDSLADCRMLSRLDVSHNKITSSDESFPPDLFGLLGLLSEVNLAANQFAEAPKHLDRVRSELNCLVHLEMNPCYDALKEAVPVDDPEKADGPEPEPELQPEPENTTSNIPAPPKGLPARKLVMSNPTHGGSTLFRVGWSDMCGKRPVMEDALIMRANWCQAADLFGIDEDQEEGAREGPVDLFAVFDGHGGEHASRFSASRFSTRLKRLIKDHYPVEALKQAIRDVNAEYRAWIRDKDITVRHAGTTALVGLFTYTHLYIANLGDTRAVLCRGGKAIPLTVDHKPSSEEDRIAAMGGYVTTTQGGTRRINGMIAVSRSIGDFYMSPYVIDKAFMIEQPIDPNDEFIILACDGIWDELSNQQAVDMIRDIDDPFAAAAALRDHAYIRDSDDNISVLVLRLQDAPKAARPQRPPRNDLVVQKEQTTFLMRRATLTQLKRSGEQSARRSQEVDSTTGSVKRSHKSDVSTSKSDKKSRKDKASKSKSPTDKRRKKEKSSSSSKLPKTKRDKS